MYKRKNNLIKSLAAGALLFATSAMMSQEMNVAKWKPIFEREIKGDNERVIVPTKYKTFRIDENFKDLLFTAPHENSVAMQNSNVVVELPMPDGTVQKFRIVEAPVMAAELAAQVPQIKTFNAMGIDVPGTYAKLDYTEFGFHAMIFSPEGRIFIDPYSRNNTQDYITYYTSDFSKAQADRMIPECGATNFSETGSTERLATPPPSVMANIFAGATLRTYRFAVACTGEYAVAATGVGAPTFAQILSVVTTTVNRVDGVYETEAAIRLVLVANENLILFGNAGTDPFNGNNNASTLINESQTVINGAITTGGYDIGHTFSTGGGGLAGLGVVCLTGQKARGITGSSAPVGDAYDIDYVAHEVGHQFSGNHSYNECAGNATQNPGTMVEPGGGVTIMGYAGICAAADNIAMNSIAYFHTISFDEIMTFSNTGGGNSCPVATSTGNNPPAVTGSGNYTIPRSTPFTLTGSATDPNGDALTYSWEEIDNNSTAHAVGTAAPYFRSLVPTTSPSRTFPRLATVLTGATSNLGEYLPATAGTLNFRLIARDNKMGGGGVHYAANTVTIASTGPFTVTAPNTAVTWASSSTQTVTWSVASSNIAPVNCANVKISLSIDGGNTFPTVIFASTANDGTESITVPPQAVTRTQCRIKVEAVGNIFFDISNVNFTITASASPIAGVAITQSAGSNPMCPAASATFSATPTNGGTAPSYQWQVNGANVGTNSNTYTTTTLTNGQVVTCIMTSNLGGVVGNPATSNAITMVVGSTVPSVTIAGPTVICAGATATYTATPVNGGGAPTYQWQVSGSNAGTNSATFASSTLTNGQTVTCTMTSNAGCQATPTVTSNTLTVTVNSASALPFTQNFEGTFPPAGWVVENADAPSAVWGGVGAKGLVTRPAVANTGSAVGCAAIEFYNYNTDTMQVDNLVSVPVNLTGATAPKMTFKRSYKTYVDGTSPSNYRDELKIYISTDCGATYGSYVYFKKGAQLASNGTNNAAHTPAVAADWDTDTIDLSSYVNQNVIVKFEAINRYGNNLYLDDINISSSAGAIPVANFTAAATKCAGSPIVFTDASTNTPTSWTWSTNPTAGVTITSPTSQNPNITFATAGTYTVTHTATNASGTSPSYTQAVVVNALPTVTATSAPVSGTVCAGTSVTLTGGGASTYAWTGGATNGVAFTPAATTTYTVTGTAATGCTNTATKLITVNPLPVATATNNGPVCAGSPLTLTGGASGMTSYSWSGPSAYSNTTQSPTVSSTATAAMAGTYTLTITNANGCQGSITTVVAVNALPTVTATSAPVSGTVCAGTSVTLTGGGASTYTWTSGVTNATAFTPTVTATYTVTGTAANGCVNTATKLITVNPLPVMTSVTTSNACTGVVVNFPFTSNVASTYSWVAANTGTVGGETTTPQVGSSITNTLTITGTTPRTITYSVTPTATPSGCVGAVQTLTITVNPLPTVTATSAPASGTVCAGAQVTLTGGGASTYVWTGGVNDGVAFTPAGTLTYTVTGTATTGCTNTATRLITVNAAPTVTATSAPVSGTVCSGTPVTLTGGGASTYTWTGGVTNGTSFTPAVGTVTYTVTGTDANGCAGTATKVITVNASPTVTATSAPVSGVVCTGTSVILTGGGASTYTWTGGVTNGTSFTPAVGTITYTVTGTAVNGCTNTATKIITVNALPNVSVNSPSTCSGVPTTLTGGGASTYSWSTSQTGVSISVSPTGNTSYTVTGTDVNGCVNTAVSNVIVTSAPNVTVNSVTICAGQPATLTGAGATAFSWNTGDNTAAITVNPTGTTSYTVTGSNGPGCQNTAVATVTVNNLPTVTASASSTIVCSGTQVTLTGGGTATSFVWTGGAVDATAFTPPVGAITYTVTGTDANGCVNTAVQPVTVNALPTISVTSLPASAAVCNGANITLSGNGGTSYTWTGGISNGVAFTPSTGGTYTVTGTDANGCQNTVTQAITVGTNPTVSTSSSASTTVCSGVAVTLTASGASSYSWNTGDVTDIISVNPSVTTTYTATGTDANGCVGTSNVTVNVYAVNTPTVSQTGNTLTASGAVSYQWYLDGNILTGETNSTITATQNGTYTVVTVDANGCSATSAGTLVSGIGIKETSSSATLVSIYPNPSTGYFTVSAVLNHNNEYTTQLTNVIGQVIYSETVHNVGAFKKQFTTADLKTGVYFFIITDQNGANSVSKVIIE